METIQTINKTVNKMAASCVPKGKLRRFFLMVEHFSLRTFTSLNAAGRMASDNRYTGENRVRRAISDNTLAGLLGNALVQRVFSKLSGYVFCSLDHSQFGPFCIAVLAVSFRRGRAIPIWCQVNTSEAALIKPLLAELERLFIRLPAINPDLKLVLVMDRWFASRRLFNLFSAHGIYFIARTKSDKKIRLPWDTSWQRTKILEVSHEEVEIVYCGHELRLIRSTYDEDKRKETDTEPWFLMTNLPPPSHKGATDGFSRQQMLNRYTERFEIEEAFKDIKWLNRLEWQQIKKPEVIYALLIFVFFGRWLIWWATPQKEHMARLGTHHKKRLSWFRVAWEHLERIRCVDILVPDLLGWGEK
jgi:hypothetical protein